MEHPSAYLTDTQTITMNAYRSIDLSTMDIGVPLCDFFVGLRGFVLLRKLRHMSFERI